MARSPWRSRGCATEAAPAALAADDPAHERVVALLRKRHGQLAQIRQAMRLRALLEVWLYVHVPLTVMLLAALSAHILSVFYYW